MAKAKNPVNTKARLFTLVAYPAELRA